jgi:hypothetical protein
MTRVLLFQNNVPKIYWSDAVLTATYLINRLPSANLNYKSPLEILYQRKINLEYLKIFGCTCYVHKNKQDKLDYTSIKTIFLGYSSQKKRYKCYDPKNKRLYISRDVTFLENEPYYKEKIHEEFIRETFKEITLPQFNPSIEEVRPIELEITPENEMKVKMRRK